ncbi:hypothetical protein FRC01_006876 [Tulasnella sp. 417]|nr:hypothetical protein FRC01_006876 [Tulasnella sp. 417]
MLGQQEPVVMLVKRLEDFDLADFYRDYEAFTLEPVIEAPNFVHAARAANFASTSDYDTNGPATADALPAALGGVQASAGPAAGENKGGPVTATDHKLEKKREKNCAKKRKRRDKINNDDEEVRTRRVHFLADSKPQHSEAFQLQFSRHAKSGYVGVADRGLDYGFLTGSSSKRLTCLLVQGYDLVELERAKQDTLFCDAQGRIFAVVLAWPTGWERRTAQVNAAMERLQSALKGNSCPLNRRRPFAAYATGYSFGGGRKTPLPFHRTAREQAAIDQFLADSDVQAALKYIRGVMKTWFLQHVDRYDSCLNLYSDKFSLHPPSLLPFPAMTLNSGRNTVCSLHRDSPNDAAGVCLDYILGEFNHRLGGHLVLHEA